jgi:radical SAM family uncharacterized protein/radical SAM-linked protein
LVDSQHSVNIDGNELSQLLVNELLEKVERPGQYLGREWGAALKPFAKTSVHLALAFPDLYELGMSNFGQRILYNLVNRRENFLCDRTYAPGSDMEALLRERNLPLWGFESRQPLNNFELLGFSLAYELTYTNVLNMLQLAHIPVLASERKEVFPLVFGGGPAAVNPEPMALFMDFFVIGDGEDALPAIMEVIHSFIERHGRDHSQEEKIKLRRELLLELATKVSGVYVPSLYEAKDGAAYVQPTQESLPKRVDRQVCPLNNDNQPTEGPVSFLNLVHDRQVLEVRRGCDRGCRFCQPGYTFLPVRERSADDLLKLSKQALDNSGHQEYSMLSLCVSDYTALHESVRTLNDEHKQRRASLSFPSQRADRMNLDIAEELKVVRKSGITLAPEAGTERLRKVINKGLNHQQIISAIESAYKSGWSAIKLYFMLGLPTELDEDLQGIVDILKEANQLCRAIRRQSPSSHRRDLELTCTISNFVPKPFTPFQWFGQINLKETARRQEVLRKALRESGLRNVRLNFTQPIISLLEAVISRGDRSIGQLILKAWQRGAVFDAWDDRLKSDLWYQAADELNLSLEKLACTSTEVGSDQPWDIVNIGLNNWWLVREWEKAMATSETAPCTENTCHACGVCTDLETTHVLATVKPEQLKRNPFIKELSANDAEDSHPSLFFMKPEEAPAANTNTKIRFELKKTNELRFISHLDLQHLLVRAARRAQVNVAYTEGFNPSPKLALAQALSLGQESLGEVGELELAETVDADDVVVRLNAKLPQDVQLVRARTVSIHKQSLASLVGQAKYKCYAPDTAGNADLATQVRKTIADLLNQATIEVVSQAVPTKQGSRKEPAPSKVKDIKSGVYNLEVVSESPLTLELTLACSSNMHVKPSDLLKLINSKINWRIVRLSLASPEGIPLFDLPSGSQNS